MYGTVGCRGKEGWSRESREIRRKGREGREGDWRGRKEGAERRLRTGGEIEC